MKPCFGYIRVSTQKQGEGVSLEAQKDSILAFASHQNITIMRWFEEKETAAKSGRPIFNQMLKLLRQGVAKGMVIHKIDRSARNLKDWAVISDLSDAGVDVYFATETLDFRSRGGRLTADIQAVIAADFIRNLREESKKGMNGRLKQGLYPFRAPIGYLDNGRGKPKTLDPAKSPLIKLAFDLYTRGEHSLRSLEAEMYRRGLRNVAGGPLSLHGIETVLSNSFYCGLIHIKRTGETFPGVHEPLISSRQFLLVKDIKAGRCGKKVTRHNHLYRGLFRCGHCDGPMTPEIQKGHVYYRCQKATCPTKTLREDVLDQVIQNTLKGCSITPDQRERYRTGWNSWIESGAKERAGQALELRIAAAKARLDRLTDLLIDGTITKDDFNTRKQSLMLEINGLEGERLQSEHLSSEEMETFLELTNSLAGLHKVAKPEEKREMVKNAFSNRHIAGKAVYLEPCSWLHIDENTLGVSYGDPSRHTYRTDEEFETFESNVRKFLEVFESFIPKSDAPKPFPKWRHNLKNQALA